MLYTTIWHGNAEKCLLTSNQDLTCTSIVEFVAVCGKDTAPIASFATAGAMRADRVDISCPM